MTETMAMVQDRVIEMAKDLLMIDTGAILERLRVECPPGGRTDKQIAFEGLVAALHGARAMAENFRAAHVAERKQGLREAMAAQVAERLAEIDREEMERRRAS